MATTVQRPSVTDIARYRLLGSRLDERHRSWVEHDVASGAWRAWHVRIFLAVSVLASAAVFAILRRASVTAIMALGVGFVVAAVIMVAVGREGEDRFATFHRRTFLRYQAGDISKQELRDLLRARMSWRLVLFALVVPLLTGGVLAFARP